MERKRLSFSDRWMFNRVMCQESICRRIIRAAFDIDAERISYINAEQAFEPGSESRGVRMDVVARGDGQVYDIELQVEHEPLLGRRMRYYQAAMDVSELERGDTWGVLSESRILFICLNDPYKLGLPEYTLERTCLEEPSLDVSDGSHWKVLNAQAWADIASPELADLLQYLEEGTAHGKLSREIDSLVIEFNDDREWVNRVMLLEEDVIRRCRLEREEGRAEAEARVSALMSQLFDLSRIEDASRAARDEAYRQELFREFGL